MNQEQQTQEAKLLSTKDGLAEFVLGSELNQEESNVFFWPEEYLPTGIETGDEVVVALDFKNKEEKTIQVKQKAEKQLKQDEMRKLLEELVN